MPSTSVKIYQPFHDSISYQNIDRTAIGLDWTANPRPELRETAIYLHMAKNLDRYHADYIGLFSPKFSLKGMISLRDFIAFVKANPGHDVYFVNPFPSIPYLAFNAWDQAEVVHSGIVDIAKSSFKNIGITGDAFDIRHSPKVACFCNFWVATPKFFAIFAELLEGMIPTADRQLYEQMFSETSHDLTTAPFFPFIAERLLSTLISRNSAFSYLAFPYSRQQILNKCHPGLELAAVTKNLELIDRLDKENLWTKAHRKALIEDYRRIAAFANQHFAENGLPFVLSAKSVAPDDNEIKRTRDTEYRNFLLLNQIRQQAMISSFKGHDQLPADFDPIEYVKANPDLLKPDFDPFEHYVKHGIPEGRWPK